MATDKFMTGISITFEEKAIVDEYQKKSGVSFSSTLGMIIREWASMKAGMVSIPKAGIVKDGDKIVIDPKYWNTDDGVEQSR
jgi:hypothetical protein